MDSRPFRSSLAGWRRRRPADPRGMLEKDNTYRVEAGNRGLQRRRETRQSCGQALQKIDDRVQPTPAGLSRGRPLGAPCSINLINAFVSA
jgi:hypothetical protein